MTTNSYKLHVTSGKYINTHYHRSLQRKRMDELGEQRAHGSITIRLGVMRACDLILAIKFQYGKKEHRVKMSQNTGKKGSHMKHKKHHKNTGKTDHIIDVPFQPV